MVRPFQGFMAEDGTVYDTEKECEAYEAAFDLHKTIREQDLLEKLDFATQNYVITEVVKFINDNKPIVARYIEAGSNPQTIQYQKDLFNDHNFPRTGEEQLDRSGEPDQVLSVVRSPTETAS